LEKVMKQRVLAILFIMLALACNPVRQMATPIAKPTLTAQPVSTVAFNYAKASDDSSPEFFTLVSGGRSIVVTWNDGGANAPQGNDGKRVRLEIKQGYFVEKLLFAQCDNDLILAYEITNHDQNSSQITRIDGQKMTPVWTTQVPGFNLGIPVMRGSSVYVSAIGMLGKLRVETGEYIWKHDNLYESESYSFNAFNPPVFNGTRVIFEEVTSNHSPKSIELDDITGQILGVYQNGGLFHATPTPWPTPTPSAPSVKPKQPTLQNVELIGQIGGGIGGLSVRGDYAYVSVGPRLVILNVSDPARPAVVGQTAALSSSMDDVVVAGDYAYLAVSDEGLRIINIANPATPVEMGSYSISGRTWALAIVGDRAYLSDVDDGLHIVNVADPAHPTRVGFHYQPGILNMAIVGDYAYLAVLGSFHIVNIADPNRPIEVSHYDPPGDSSDFGALALGVFDVAVVGTYAYLAVASGLDIVNVSNPKTPVEVSLYKTPVAQSVAVAGQYAYLATTQGLHVVNIANPSAPTKTSVYDKAAIGRVNISENYLYGTDGRSLHIINAVTPQTLVEVGHFDTSGPLLADPIVTVASGFAYVGDGKSLRIISITNPVDLVEAGFYDTPGTVSDVAVSGTYAYVADGQSGLRTINLADPAHPTEVGHYLTPGAASGIAVAGNYAYISEWPIEHDGQWAGGGGLRIVNIANPATPVEVGFYDTPGDGAGRVTVVRNYAYVADGSKGGLRIIDVSDPAHPVEAGFYDTPGSALDVAVGSSGYVYVADSDSLLVLNVADLKQPIVSGSYPMPRGSGQALYVTLSDNFAYVASGNGGLRIINVSNPAAMSEVGFYAPRAHIPAVAVADGYIYVAQGNCGLAILRLAKSR
jgi:hypothetical protein